MNPNLNVRSLYIDCFDTTNPSTKTLVAFIKEYKIQILHEFEYARGVVRLITQEEYDRVKKEVETENQTVKEQNGAHNELHFGALETKCDRMEAELRGINQTLVEMVKASNLLADEIKKVTQQLA